MRKAFIYKIDMKGADSIFKILSSHVACRRMVFEWFFAPSNCDCEYDALRIKMASMQDTGEEESKSFFQIGQRESSAITDFGQRKCISRQETRNAKPMQPFLYSCLFIQTRIICWFESQAWPCDCIFWANSSPKSSPTEFLETNPAILSCKW